MSSVAFIDRNHDETTFGCIDIFRWTIFYFITVEMRSCDDIGEASRTAAGYKRAEKRTTEERFINQLKL